MSQQPTWKILQIINAPHELFAKFVGNNGKEFSSRIACLALVEQTDRPGETFVTALEANLDVCGIDFVEDIEGFEGYMWGE